MEIRTVTLTLPAAHRDGIESPPPCSITIEMNEGPALEQVRAGPVGRGAALPEDRAAGSLPAS